MKATIIGAGNMGGSVACGLAKGTTLNAENITCVDSDPEALERLRETGLPFRLTTDIRKSIGNADILIFAIKPFALEEVISNMRDLLDFRRQIIFSTVAGVTFDQLNACILRDNKTVKPIMFRVMPNLAISIGESMTLISEQNATKAQIRLADTIFSEMGKTMFVPERLLAAGMAVGSCGIAYTMRYIRAMMQGGVNAGLPAGDAYAIALQTIKGAVEMLIESGSHPEVEIDKVATAGGYTIRGLVEMESKGFSNAVISGIGISSKTLE